MSKLVRLFPPFMKKLFFIIVATYLFRAAVAHANPSQTGETGLFSVPSAETLDAGNICVGLWGNLASKDGKQATTVPVSLTLGIGTFWEIYGSYPNILFNGKEDYSGRGNAELGTKLRFIGKRSSPFKVAADMFVQRQVSEDPVLDGTTNIGGRVIASYNTDRAGVHLYTGYLFPGKPADKEYRNEILYGAGAEFSPSMRVKVTAEIVGSTNRDKSIDAPLDGIIGFQYYLSPHLTLNLAGIHGFTNGTPDWRAVFGLTACQGVGNYIKPVPRLGLSGDESGDKKKEPLKVAKIVPISSLLVKSLTPEGPVSKLEVPVEPDKEEITIIPYGQVTIAPQPAAVKAVVPTHEEVAITRSGEEVKLASAASSSLESSAYAYTMNRLEGVTPLYGIDVKGQNVKVASAERKQLPETMTVYRKFRFPDVTFDFDQWTLSAEGKKSLSEVAELIRKDKKWVYLRVDGHTDNIGSVDYNMDLSLKRAIAVASYLIAREGIDAGRIFLKGLGKSKPLADNATPEGRRVNRRCEILFLVQKENL